MRSQPSRPPGKSKLSTGGELIGRYGGPLSRPFRAISGKCGRAHADGVLAAAAEHFDMTTETTKHDESRSMSAPLIKASQAACFLRNTLPKSVKPACD